MAVRAVQYARTLGGALVAVERGPHDGWEAGGTVYATETEARAADGKASQRIYIDEQLGDIGYGMSSIIDGADPFADWRNKYSEHERKSDLVDEILGQLFPKWGTRSEAAERFADAFALANAVYVEMCSGSPAPSIAKDPA